MPSKTKSELARSSAALKAWATRRNNKNTQTRTPAALTNAANKAWATRRANAVGSVSPSLIASLRPSTPVAATQPADSLTKGLRKRNSVSAKTVVEKINTAGRIEYFAGSDRSVLVMYTK